MATTQRLVGPYVYTGINNDYQSEVATSCSTCYRYGFHYGTDMIGRQANGTTAATVVYSCGTGVVTDVRLDSNESTALGSVVVVRYGSVENTKGVNIGTVYLRYCHLGQVYVETGDVVYPSDRIGVRGTSGYGCDDDQPHLHLEATRNSNANANNSPTESGNSDSLKLNPRDILFSKTSTSDFGKRVVVVDSKQPFNSNINCPHGKAWYDEYDAPSYD